MTDIRSSNHNFQLDPSLKTLEPTQDDHTFVENHGDEPFQEEFQLPAQVPDDPELRLVEADELGINPEVDEEPPQTGSTDGLLEFCVRYGVKPIIILQLFYYLSLILFLFIGIRRVVFRFEDVMYQMECHDLKQKIYSVSVLIVDLILFLILPMISAIVHSLTLASFYHSPLTRLHKTKPSQFVQLLAIPQILIVAHCLAEFFIFLPEFFVEMDTIWRWAVVTFNLAIFSFHCFCFNMCFGVAEIDNLLYTWSMERMKKAVR